MVNNTMQQHSETLDRRAILHRKMERQKQLHKFTAYRIRVLPGQLDAARRKLAALENEAARLGMHDLLEKTDD